MVADHFSVIGFKANSTEALSALVTNLLEKGGKNSPVPQDTIIGCALPWVPNYGCTCRKPPRLRLILT